MRVVLTIAALALASSVAASPIAAAAYHGSVAVPPPVTPPPAPAPAPVPPVVYTPGSNKPAYSSNGGNNSGDNGGNGGNSGGSNNGNSGGSNSGNTGGSNGGSNNGGSNSGNTGGSQGGSNSGSSTEVCGLKPNQIAALTPLVAELKLTRTVDDLKRLVHQITDLLGNTLQQPAITSILDIVDNLVRGLGLGGLGLKPAVDNITSLLFNQVPCLVNTLLPKP
ncbi:hypothetical protein GGI12_003574 [Dipsacomyces acuminosporus]|nr:hypothetical protein GGI12_003574 [Dipsacomyces acuminosporus]